jgi:serine/threonine-protein kinase RsbW
MDAVFSLCLPTASYSIPLSRHLCADVLSRLGVTEACSHDIQIALTEACTNVFKHTSEDFQYEVEVTITQSQCRIKVTDAGTGFDASDAGRESALPDAEAGRGMHLMSTVVDRVHFDSRPQTGTVVRFTKQLELEDNSPLAKLRGLSAQAGS